jgi:hypothetical protein
MNKLPQNDFETPKRITWGSTWSDVLDVIDFDKGILLTIKELVIHPKATINDYLYGNRSKYANPLRFLLFSTAIITLLNFYLVYQPTIDKGLFNGTEQGNVFNVEFNSNNTTSSTDIQTETLSSDEGLRINNDSSSGKIPVERVKEIILNSLNELFNWMDKFTFALVPLFSFFTFWFFRKTKYNYTENLAINAYMVSITNVIGIVLVLPSFYSPTNGGVLLALISSGFTLYFTFKVFADQSIKGGLKVLVAFIITYFLYFIMLLGFLVAMIINSAEEFQ